MNVWTVCVRVCVCVCVYGVWCVCVCVCFILCVFQCVCVLSLGNLSANSIYIFGNVLPEEVTVNRLVRFV
jgi:hypothetical protein